ncbi:hypothetical protein BOX15_Mlig009994g1, partial [Macrostomum lignano]
SSQEIPEPRRQFSAIMSSSRDLFNAFDVDGNGSLDLREFGALMRAFGASANGRRLKEAEVAGILGRVDSDASGCVDFAEFEAAADVHLRRPLPDLGRLAEFRAADADSDGLLTVEEAAAAARKLGRQLRDVGAENCGGCDGRRLINYVEFLQLLA